MLLLEFESELNVEPNLSGVDCLHAQWSTTFEGKVGKLEISGDWNRSFDIAVPTIFFADIRAT